MMTKHRSLTVLAAVFATALGGAAFAQGSQGQAPQAPTPQQAPTTGQGTMGGQMNMMSQMNKMMDNCDTMMERAMQAPPAGSAAPQQKG